ncbi:hypothetical protein BKP56_10015 [Marinilactibacillus sp. 15R]|nr:hypothetical protein BKP56_10015 [Marinilactibacillus sp. 15R]
MHSRNKLKSVSLFLMLSGLFFLYACSASESMSKEEPSNHPTIEGSKFIQIDQSKETLQKIVGWLDNDEVLVHLGDQKGQQLIQLNIKNGDRKILYSTEKHILTVKINNQLDKILFQEGSDQSVDLVVVNLVGDELNRKKIDYSGYLTVNWNPVEDHLVFLSYYQVDSKTSVEQAKVRIWNLENNQFQEMPIQSVEPNWYSSHLYLYIDELSKQLFIGDVRKDETPDRISNETIGFYLNQDTVVSILESDINDHEVHLMKDYPLLVHKGTITIPKVTMGERIIHPYLSQSNRDGMIVGNVADEPTDLNQNLGSFTLCILDFQNSQLHPVTSLPENAPILLSPDEKYVLYGWQFEKVIDLEGNSSIHSLISDSI